MSSRFDDPWYYMSDRYREEKSIPRNRCEKCRLSDAEDEFPRARDKSGVWCYWDGLKVSRNHCCDFFKNWLLKEGKFVVKSNGD